MGAMNKEAEADGALALRLGNAIRRHRLERGWTQEQLAELAQTSVNHVSYIERGERLPSVPMLIQLAQALRITVGELLGETETDVWASRVVALSRALPEEAKPVVLAMLQGAMRGPSADPVARETNDGRGAPSKKRSAARKSR